MKTLIELKSDVYDALVQVEVWQKKLKEANEAIANYKEPVKEDLPKENKKV